MTLCVRSLPVGVAFLNDGVNIPQCWPVVPVVHFPCPLHNIQTYACARSHLKGRALLYPNRASSSLLYEFCLSDLQDNTGNCAGRKDSLRNRRMRRTHRLKNPPQRDNHHPGPKRRPSLTRQRQGAVQKWIRDPDGKDSTSLQK